MRKKRIKPENDSTPITIFARGSLIKGKRIMSGMVLGEDNNIYQYSKQDGRWRLLDEPVPTQELVYNRSKLGDFVNVGENTYQYQEVDGLIRLVLVLKATKVTSLGFVQSSGKKATTPGR